VPVSVDAQPEPNPSLTGCNVSAPLSHCGQEISPTNTSKSESDEQTPRLELAIHLVEVVPVEMIVLIA
jgi:hypothetical protein